jgi:hypothetical protein
MGCPFLLWDLKGNHDRNLKTVMMKINNLTFSFFLFRSKKNASGLSPIYLQDSKISLWNLYKLITDANKSFYIDGFLDRGVNAQKISNELILGLERNQSWFL